ncbi:MAG: hypothetical protein J7513_13910 [Solirubrobacteraceae bacterium]|nr:hypothetical protein [Solirubrobacteraceae bacterium]
MELIRLSENEWRPRAAAHEARVDGLVAEHLDRRRRGEKHAVEDFLFDYYGFSPARLRRWSPGAGVALEGAGDDPIAGWKFMSAVDWAGRPEGSGTNGDPQPSRHTVRVSRPEGSGTNEDPQPSRRLAGGGVALDAAAFLEARGKAVGFVRRLLEATLEREIHTGCFGLHEWAMVYREPEERRHGGLPLRLGAADTDAVVEASTLRCSHFDATRFFTGAGLARNTLTPTREGMVDHEQPGCLHAGMDVYRWAYKLAPAVPSELTADAFELAREIRTLDMQASPYDLRDLGYEPVPIETPEGRRDYATRQRAFGERANALRVRLLEAIATVDASASPPLAATPQR